MIVIPYLIFTHECDNVSVYFVYFQSYIKIYQGEELPHPKSMLQVDTVLFKYILNCKRTFDL